MFATPAPVLPGQQWPAIYAPAPWIVLDIETADAPEEAIAAAADAWKAPSNWKADTVVRRRAEAKQRIAEDAALLDAAPIAVIAVQTPHGAALFTAFGAVEVPGVTVFPSADERDMLRQFRSWLELVATPGETEVAGHRLKAFDLPKIRHGCLRQRLRPPAALTHPDAPIFDLEQRIRWYSTELYDAQRISLDAVCRCLGVPLPKEFVSGAEVPGLLREGRYAEVATYAAIDVAATTRAFLLMSGQASDLE